MIYAKVIKLHCIIIIRLLLLIKKFVDSETVKSGSEFFSLTAFIACSFGEVESRVTGSYL